MNKSLKSKKSTTKNRKIDTSKLIPIIAVVEAVILVAVTTFAWFYLSKNKTLSSGIVTVEADSGLEIDFSDADKSSYIDIFNYIDRDTFYFEPATSVDGRNIYFPTSGTFDADKTENMVFREGTVNDINSKYIDIDFELTNNSDQEMEIFLSNRSQFLITDDKKNQVNSKALRLAFYNNDGNSGKVNSSFANKFKSADIAGSSSVDSDQITVYFYRNTDTWNTQTIYAYLYDSTDTAANTETIDEKEIEFKNSGYSKAWPGQACSWVSGNVYSYTFSNPYKTYTDTYEKDGETVEKVYTSETLRRYDTIMFSDGGDTKKTNKLSISNGKIYHDGMADGSTGDTVEFKTVYFLKPRDWTGTPKCGLQVSSEEKWYGEGDTGYNMKQEGTGVYSYTFPTGETIDDTYKLYDKIQFFDSDDVVNRKSSLTSGVTNQALYYFPAGGESGALSTISGYSDCNLYFYNSEGWDQPYANINAMADSVSFTKYTYSIPMVDLTGGLYYIEVPSVFMYDQMSSVAPGLADNCSVYFSEGSQGTGEKTASAQSKTNYIYTPSGSSSPYALGDRNYATELDITDQSYAVISPGVSAGFQRNSNPVKTINNTSGAATAIVPTFASSFDDFIMGSNNPVFKIASHKTVNMSMIIWLEGTDADCVEANYAGKNINLYLEFSTIKSMDSSDETYTYRFTDATEEIWTSDTVTNAAGVEVNPVMQMYDVDAGRGYIMYGKSYSSYDGKNKVRDWECLAPQSILNSGHNIEFRRVNPYNESEIWNVWQAGNITTYKAYSFDARTRVVSFTAFADGAPDYDYYHSRFADNNIPKKSCGGVWGQVETQRLYVYDGRKTRNIEDSMGNVGESGYLFCNYEYQYPNDGPTVTLEYKGSSHYNAFFSFVVPTSIYTQQPTVTFPNYVMLSDYASNAEQQKGKISQRNIYNAGKLKGQFYELNTSHSNAEYEHSYWGSDVVYVQAKNTLGRSYTNDFAFYQLYFHGTDGTDNFYSYMYENNNYKGSGINNSFVAVVPAEGSYDSFHFEAAKHNSHSDKIRYDLGTHAIESAVDDTTKLRMNTVHAVGDTNDGRILTLDWDWAQIYYRGNGDWSGDNDWVYNITDDSHANDFVTVYYFDGGTGDGHYNMTNDSYDSVANRRIVIGYVPSNCTIQFKFNKASDSQHTHSGKYSANGMDGHIFVADQYDNGYSQISLASYGGMAANMKTTGTYNKVGTTQYNNDNWPEYTRKSTYDPTAAGS